MIQIKRLAVDAKNVTFLLHISNYLRHIKSIEHNLDNNFYMNP